MIGIHERSDKVTAFERHKRFLEENRDVLVKAEKIRKSKEYLKAMHYFKILKIRGNIENEPCADNGFSIVKTEKRRVNEEKYHSCIR